MDDRPYYYRLRGRTIGPLPLRQMRQLAQRAQIGRTTDVSRDGQQWGKASDFAEVFQAESAFDPPVDPINAPLDEGFQVSPGPNSPSAITQGPLWYYTLNGDQQGPVTLAALQQLVSNGTLSPQEHVIPEGGTEWITVMNVPMPATAVGNYPAVPLVPQPKQASGGGSALAIAGFVLSLLSVPLGCLCGFFSLPLSVLGLIFSAIAASSKDSSMRGLAVAGVVISLVSIVISVVVVILGVALSLQS